MDLGLQSRTIAGILTPFTALLYLTCIRICDFYLIHSWFAHAHVSTLSGWVLPYPAGYGFPLRFSCWPSLLALSCSRCGIGPSLRSGYWPAGQTATGLSCSASLRNNRPGCLLYAGACGVRAGGQSTPLFTCGSTPPVSAIVSVAFDHDASSEGSRSFTLPIFALPWGR